MADLRVCAAEIFAAGAPTVLILPSLAPELAERVLIDSARQLGGSPWLRWRAPTLHLQGLLRAVDAARRTVATWHTSSMTDTEEEHLELALDICLFANPV